MFNRALWPKILERAYSKSAEIYVNAPYLTMKKKEHRKSVTGLFHLVRHYYGPLLGEDRRGQSDHSDYTYSPSKKHAEAQTQIRSQLGNGCDYSAVVTGGGWGVVM